MLNRSPGFEYWSDQNNPTDGYVSWLIDDVPTGRVGAAAFGPDPLPDGTGVGQRLISVEPMVRQSSHQPSRHRIRMFFSQAIIMNLGISNSWQVVDPTTMVFPSYMYIDYVRVYQRHGTPRQDGVGCDPPNFPTMDYIARHADAYYSASQTRLVCCFFGCGG